VQFEKIRLGEKGDSCHIGSNQHLVRTTEVTELTSPKIQKQKHERFSCANIDDGDIVCNLFY
jgi:hypothetical protein